MGEVGGEEGDGSGGINRDDNYGMHYPIKLTTPLEEIQVFSSSLVHSSDTKGLFTNPLIPL